MSSDWSNAHPEASGKAFARPCTCDSNWSWETSAWSWTRSQEEIDAVAVLVSKCTQSLELDHKKKLMLSQFLRPNAHKVERVWIVMTCSYKPTRTNVSAEAQTTSHDSPENHSTLTRQFYGLPYHGKHYHFFTKRCDSLVLPFGDRPQQNCQRNTLGNCEEKQLDDVWKQAEPQSQD